MKKALLLCVLVLTVNPHGQQIAEIDLIRQQPDNAEERDVDVVPNGCGVRPSTNSDGVIVNTEKRPKLKVELMLSKNTFEQGDRVEGKVLLKNAGTSAITIPWNVDPHVGKRPSGVLQHEYEMGWFDLELKGSSKISIPLELESESSFLYTSPSNPGSSLAIEPGQQIAAKLMFRLEEKRKLSSLLALNPGKAEIRVQWRQARFTWRRNGCTVETGYFNYDYEEDRRPASIEILK